VVAKKDGTYVPREKRPQQEPATKKQRTGDGMAVDADASTNSSTLKLMTNNVPHNILFAQALPEHCTKEVLSELFQKYSGFVEVRMVPGKKEIAFIEFGDHIQAGIALQALNGFKLVSATDVEVARSLHLTYAKK
jgi:RNA recognition motif-containing protein